MSEIGVLLPIRLETRVDQDAALAWQLRLRVTPDEASVIRHRDSASSVEWQLLTRFWNAFDGPTAGQSPAAVWLDTPSGVAAWGAFVSTPQPDAPLVPETPNRVEASRKMSKVAAPVRIA